VDAGKRTYCRDSLDGGLDARVGEGGTADVPTSSPDLGNDVGNLDLAPPAVDGRAGDSGEVGSVDSSGGETDLGSSDARAGANDLGGTGGSAGNGGSTGSTGSAGSTGGTGNGGASGSTGAGDARGLDGDSISGGDGGIDVSGDRGSPDLLPDARADAPVANDANVFDVVADAVADTSTVVDLASNAVSDVPAPTCSTSGVSWAKAWIPWWA
jgi:hypothetical protein